MPTDSFTPGWSRTTCPALNAANSRLALAGAEIGECRGRTLRATSTMLVAPDCLMSSLVTAATENGTSESRGPLFAP